MPQPDDTHDEAIKRLDQGLDAFAKTRVRPSSAQADEAQSVGQGYRLLAVLISGVLGGLGFGWFIDHLAHTTPFGLIGGLLIGTVASIYSMVRTAMRMSDQAKKRYGPAPSVPNGDED
jgi:ATP synthase protein I